MGGSSVEQWRNEHRIEVLLNNPAVRFRIEQAAQSSSRPMSGEQFLKTTSNIMGVIPGMTIPAMGFRLASYAGGQAGQRIREASGMNVKHAASMSYSQPVGQVTVALLCSLARNGYPINRIVQAEDGCFLEAVLPSNWQTWKGAIACNVKTEPTGTEIQIGTTIPGWGWDLGRSKKVISAILDEVYRDSASF